MDILVSINRCAIFYRIDFMDLGANWQHIEASDVGD